MSLWTPCPKCGRPQAAQDHDGGCPYVIKLQPAPDEQGVLLVIPDRIAPAWWHEGAEVELSIEYMRGATVLVIHPVPNQDAAARRKLLEREVNG